jgi:hypothetical protein
VVAWLAAAVRAADPGLAAPASQQCAALAKAALANGDRWGEGPF